jgi:hypothetical protein
VGIYIWFNLIAGGIGVIWGIWTFCAWRKNKNSFRMEDKEV